MDTLHYWWYIYGYFKPGEGKFPHVGQVIRYYRKICGMEKEEFAKLLGCTKRYVEMLESDQNVTMPELISRRILLAKILHIPPILLGLSSMVLSNEEDTVLLPELSEIDSPIDIQRVAFYEGMLALSWEFYYTSSIERAAQNIDMCFKILNDEAKNAKGFQRNQFDALLCRFYRLSALVQRERMEIDKALAQINEAVSIASRLKNAELIATSLIGRIRIYYNKQYYEQALEDAKRACSFADSDLVHDPLKGKCYQIAGEAQAYLAGDDKELQNRSISYFDKAGRIVRKGNMQPDGSYVKTDLTSIYIERAKALRMFRRFNEAHNAFEIARKNLSPELTRWQVNLLIEEAKTYFAEEDVTNCCTCLIDALPIVRAIHLHSREKPIHSLLEKCKIQEPRNEAVTRLEKVFASTVPLLS